MKNKSLELVVISVDDAATIGEYEVNKEDVKIKLADDKYKLVTALPMFEDGSYMPMCSKDGSEWVVCIAATKGGSAVDLLKFAEGVKMIHDSYGATEQLKKRGNND